MLSTIKNSRFPKPRQHGAWAMFLVPAIMSMSIASEWNWAILFLIASFVLVFLSYEPAVRLMRRWKNRGILAKELLNWFLVFGGSGMIMGVTVLILYKQWSALLFGCLIMMIMMIHLWLTVHKQNMSIPGKLVGVFGLTSSAPFLYLFLHDRIDDQWRLIWLINFLYFAGSIFYLKLKLQIQPQLPEPLFIIKLKTALPLIVFNMILIILLWIIIWLYGYTILLLLAFIPFVAKSFVGICTWQESKTLRTTRTGVFEIIHALFFLIINMIALRLY